MKRDSRGRFVREDADKGERMAKKARGIVKRAEETEKSLKKHGGLQADMQGSDAAERGESEHGEAGKQGGIGEGERAGMDRDGFCGAAEGALPTAEEFRARAKGLAVQALERLGEIALNRESAAQHAIPAGKAIIEYAYGKPGIERSGELSAGMGRVDELIESITEAAQE